jgi:CRISPR-associated protein Cmr1
MNITQTCRRFFANQGSIDHWEEDSMETLTITLRTLTPIWTGGVDGTPDRLHTTGIIGSLRWWYEAIVRGLGGWACDPAADNPQAHCKFDAEAYERAKRTGRSEADALVEGLSEVCAACYLFGATGWRRRFRLIVTAETDAGDPASRKQPMGERFTRKGKPEKPDWYFRQGLVGSVGLSCVSLDRSLSLQPILAVLKLIENYGALAAKPQLGYGQIRLAKPQVTDVESLVRSLAELASQRPAKKDENAGKPSLTEMFFTEIKPKPGNTAGMIETMLALKYDLRAAFRTNPPNLPQNGRQTLRHFVCGKERPDAERKASKVAISWLIDGKLRVWGWIPHELPVSGITRDDVVKIIYDTVTTFGIPAYWREFNSMHDTRRYTNASQFLSSLLEDKA